MPVISDFWTTFQWLREIRRCHDERVVAVYFRLHDDEAIHVGRYDEPHAVMTATAAAAWVVKNPAGAQVVVPHRVPAKNVLAIRHVPQLVGWTEVPEPIKKWGCPCPACLARGDRAFMRRVRGAFSAGISAVRCARSERDVLSALGSLEMPLERARGRLEPKKLMALARSHHPRIRQTIARLFGLFDRAQVQAAIERLLKDEDEEVRRESVESLIRTAGISKRTASALGGAPDDTVAHFVDLIEYQRINAAMVDTLEHFAHHSATVVRESVFRVAGALLADFEGTAQQRRRLEGLAEMSVDP